MAIITFGRMVLIYLVVGAFSFGAYAQSALVKLKNDTGIVEQADGSVTRWKNQVPNRGDAIQNNRKHGGEKMEETYPGKVNVGFTKPLSHMVLSNSGSYFSDDSFTVFYVGHTGDVKVLANLIGNLKRTRPKSKTFTGLRFVRKANGELAFQYASPKYTERVLRKLPENKFFFFGFSLNSNGQFRYFDNTSKEMIQGKIKGKIKHSKRNHILNLVHSRKGPAVWDQTEVVELSIYDGFMGRSKFQAFHNSLNRDYPEINTSSFRITKVTPEDHFSIQSNQDFSMTFSEAIGDIREYPIVTIDKTNQEVVGNWEVTAPSTLTFWNFDQLSDRSLVKIQVQPEIYSAEGAKIDRDKQSDYNFITEASHDYGVEVVGVPSVAKVRNGTHNLPMTLTLPSMRTQKVPVHMWVHGGGWSGGTPEKSVPSKGPYSEYLAQTLGIATIGLSYRCKGSNGTFTEAMADIKHAYDWVVKNAETYNFDLDRVFFSGGSAGTPLASLSAQREYANAKAFIGLNGIYDFENNEKSGFGNGTLYKQNIPSKRHNSAIYNLRDNPPAVLLLHGNADKVIHVSQSTMFARAVTKKGGYAKMVTYQGEPHGFYHNPEEHEDVLFEMVKFLEDMGLTQHSDNGAVTSENE